MLVIIAAPTVYLDGLGDLDGCRTRNCQILIPACAAPRFSSSSVPRGEYHENRTGGGRVGGPRICRPRVKCITYAVYRITILKYIEYGKIRSV